MRDRPEGKSTLKNALLWAGHHIKDLKRDLIIKEAEPFSKIPFSKN
jgi:hypothetical protein